MSHSLPRGNLKIEIDLRPARAESERTGRLAEYTTAVSELSGNIRIIASALGENAETVLTPSPAAAGRPLAKADPQIIDAITLLLAPIGARGLVKLILDIIEAFRAKMPTTLMADIPGLGKVQISGPGVEPADLRRWLDAVEEAHQRPPGLLYHPDGTLIRLTAQQRHR